MGDPAPPLRPVTPELDPPAVWLAQNLAGLIALLLGGLGFTVAFIVADPLWSMPDRRVTVPFLVATLIAVVISVARRERSKLLPLAGLAMAACAVVLGWFLVMATILGVTALLLLIISLVM